MIITARSVSFGIRTNNSHDADKSTLNITVVKCVGLPARDLNAGSSDPYVKLQLLPDKQHKVKTRVLRRTLNPVYDEDFTFYGISENQLEVKKKKNNNRSRGFATKKIPRTPCKM